MAYTEVEAAERERIRNDDGSVSVQKSDYRTAERFTDSSVRHIITTGTDTLAWFTIKYFNEEPDYSQMWDGYDTNTIKQFSFDWKSVYANSEVMLSGEISGQPFSMRTKNATRKKEFRINGEPTAIINGYGIPESGILFQTIAGQPFKIITILAALPYEFLNRGEDNY